MDKEQEDERLMDFGYLTAIAHIQYLIKTYKGKELKQKLTEVILLEKSKFSKKEWVAFAVASCHPFIGKYKALPMSIEEKDLCKKFR